MALITIDYGALASSEVMNNNFNYLNQRISDVSDTVITNNSSMYSNISTLTDLITEFNNAARPIGQPLLRLDNTLFDDEIRLEGDIVSRTTYSSLFEIYGTTYGEGDGSTTFKLPDFRNRTVWGADSFGYITAGLPNITGRIGGLSYDSADAQNGMNGAFYWANSGNVSGAGTGSSDRYAYFDASKSNAIYGKSNTVQPEAIKVRVVTRYK